MQRKLKELIEQNIFLDSIIEGTDSALFVVDVNEKNDFVFNRLNSSHEKISGIQTKKISGKTLDDLVPGVISKESARAIRENYQRCLNAGKRIKYEEMIPVKGQDIYWLTVLTPVRDEKGRISRIIGSATDITEQKKAERELLELKHNLEKVVKERTSELDKKNIQLQIEIEGRASLEEELRSSNEELQAEIHERAAIEEELRATNEQLVEEMKLRKESEGLQRILLDAPDESFVLIRKDGTVVKINNKAAERLGEDSKNLLGKNIYDLIPDDISGNRRRIIDNVFKTAKPVLFHDTHDKWFFENRIYPALVQGDEVKLVAIYAIDITDRVKAEKDVVFARNFSESIIDALPGVFYMFDKDGKFVKWNQNFLGQTGYSSEEMQVISPMVFFEDYEKQKVLSSISEVFKTGYSDLEANLITKHKKKIPYHWTGTKLVIDTKEYLIGIGNDISERKIFENALKESENRYQLALEAANEGIWDWYVNEDVVYYSDQWKAQLGYGSNELEDSFSTWQNLLHPDDYEFANKAMNDYVEKPQGDFLLEFRLRHKDGSYRWIHSKAASQKDKNGKIIRMFGAHTDITERKNAEKKIQESEQKFLSLYHNAPDMYVSVSPEDGSILECNNTLLETLGYKKEEIIGQPILKMYHDESINKAKFVLSEFAQDGKVNNRELILKKKNGEKLNVSLNITSVKDRKGNIKYSIFSWRDITDKKRQEQELKKTLLELERSNRDLEQFAYIASHDLQEPLRMISSFLQLLEKKYNHILDSDGKEYIAFAVDGASRMSQLIKDLLAFSRLGTRGQAFENTDLNEVIKDAIDNLSASIDENNAKIEVRKMPEIAVDKTQIVQLFQNLISNAIKFKGEKNPEIKIAVTKRKEYYEFSVADNGIGFEENYKDRIFVIFQRLHTNEEYSGTGIGLAVCKKIVERHGGNIWVKSKSGKGSTFYFTLKR